MDNYLWNTLNTKKDNQQIFTEPFQENIYAKWMVVDRYV